MMVSWKQAVDAKSNRGLTSCIWVSSPDKPESVKIVLRPELSLIFILIKYLNVGLKPALSSFEIRVAEPQSGAYFLWA